MSGVGGIIFLTVGLGLSLLVILTSFNSLFICSSSTCSIFHSKVGVVVTLIVLCCLSKRNKKRQGWVVLQTVSIYVLYMYLLSDAFVKEQNKSNSNWHKVGRAGGA